MRYDTQQSALHRVPDSMKTQVSINHELVDLQDSLRKWPSYRGHVRFDLPNRSSTAYLLVHS